MLRDIQETALINIEVEEQTMNIGIIGATGKLGTKVLDEAENKAHINERFTVVDEEE